jgi:hypothetical protein
VIERLTHDHSVINDLVMAGIMSPADAKNHPDAHRITRALGMNAQVVVDVRELHDLRPSDQFLLCSDGLTDLVEDDEIARILNTSQRDNLQRACAALIELAKQRGGHDNITAVVGYVVTPGTSNASGREPVPTEADATSVMAATAPTPGQVQPTIALGDSRDVRLAPTMVDPPVRLPSGSDTVTLAMAPETQADVPPTPSAQTAGPKIRWETSNRDYAVAPRSGARFMWIAAAICALVILGLLLWAAVR